MTLGSFVQAHLSELIFFFVAAMPAILTSLELLIITRRIRREKRKPPTIPPREAKRRAKRENERIKLAATFLNGSGIAILLAVVILPLFKSFGTHPEPISTGQTLTGVLFAFGFHLAGYLILGLWRSED